MTDQSILVKTKQGFPLRFNYVRAGDSINASLHQRPRAGDRKLGIQCGAMLAFVSAERSQGLRLTQPQHDDDDHTVWLGSTAFDVDARTYARLKAWSEDTLPANTGSAPR